MKAVKGKSIEEWRELVERGELHPSGVRAFCELEGINKSGFYYWRAKLNKAKLKKLPAFTKVEVIRPEPRKLPDPKWLAEFLLAISGGAR